MSGVVIIQDGPGGAKRTPLEDLPDEQVRRLAVAGSVEAAREWLRRKEHRSHAA